jgi:hypothetical protein
MIENGFELAVLAAYRPMTEHEYKRLARGHHAGRAARDPGYIPPGEGVLDDTWKILKDQPEEMRELGLALRESERRRLGMTVEQYYAEVVNGGAWA